MQFLTKSLHLISKGRAAHDLSVSFILTILVIFLVVNYQLHLDLSLSDESYAWYGAQRVLQGEVPILDFMAYDPGRYYWSSSIMRLLGSDDILSFRLSVIIFQFFSIFSILYLILKNIKFKNSKEYFYLVVFLIILSLWHFPTIDDAFDSSLSMFSISALTMLVASNFRTQIFISGILMGLIAIFGRNHGLYVVVGSVFYFLWYWIKFSNIQSISKLISIWGGGVFLGYLPLIMMLIFVPNFYEAFIDSIRFIFEVKSTNLNKPVPWPWAIDLTGSIADSISGIFLGIYFIFILFGGIISLFLIFIYSKKYKEYPPIFIASSILILPYAHYVFSRADWYHVCRGISPFLVALFFASLNLKNSIRFAVIAILASTSFLVMYKKFPIWLCNQPGVCEEVLITDRKMLVNPRTAQEIRRISELVEIYAGDGRGFVVAGFLIGMYPVLKAKSPNWEIYPLFPRSLQFQSKEIDRINMSNTGLFIVYNFAIDGKDELLYRNSHSRLYKYIEENYKLLSSTIVPGYSVYVKNGL